jgi:REP element-mobilizing transposase RayT
MKMRKGNWPNRKSIRLEGWDYSSTGLYFVTICTEKRKPFLGDIDNGIMGLSIPGSIAHYYWSKITDQFHSVIIDEYVVMPNHVHGIIGITDGDNFKESVGSRSHRDSDQTTKGGATGKHNPMLYKTHLGKIIRWYKGRCTFEIREREYPDFAWQGRFYDHIIRNEEALHRIRKYIYDNPLRWQIDKENGNEIHERAVKYMVAID